MVEKRFFHALLSAAVLGLSVGAGSATGDDQRGRDHPPRVGQEPPAQTGQKRSGSLLMDRHYRVLAVTVRGKTIRRGLTYRSLRALLGEPDSRHDIGEEGNFHVTYFQEGNFHTFYFFARDAKGSPLLTSVDVNGGY
jgi:hypothetical protein